MPIPGYTPTSAWGVIAKWTKGFQKMVTPRLMIHIMADNRAMLQTLAATIIVIVLGALIMRMWKRSSVNVPGPKGWPLFGPSTPEDLGAMVQLASSLGNIFKINCGFRTTVVVCDPLVANAVLVDEQAFLPKPSRPQQSVNEMLHPRAHPCLLTRTHADKAWRSMRRCMAKSFTVAEIREDFEVAKDKALAMVEVFSDLKPGSAINMAVMASSFSIDVFGLAKLGYDFESVEGGGNVPVMSLLSSCQEELALRKRNPWRRWGWLVSDGLSDASIKYSVLHAFMGQIWQTIRARGFPPEDNHTLAAQLMRLW
ncbi:cytochrome P450 [Dunaliella salina]|uniref:Cytochrome P450 n=1 Tax=Dunaliella salina TaxID=3046 RepID=A0ABQ7GFD7_DUNSA|nr:cytochrome P450 [Dunaliella salina]|eukprot:KAF5833319.1 cytochrome P450 [Dunaliella salina]